MNPPLPLLDLSGFDRTPSLLTDERDALTSLGWQLRRCRGYDRALLEWHAVERLLAPLDAAARALQNVADPSRQPRLCRDAIAAILIRCVKDNSVYWNWSEEDWVRLAGTHWRAFRTPWPTHVDVSVRFDVVACGYLLCGFDAFHRLGRFNRLALAYRIFGREAAEGALERIVAMLETWGYRSARTDLQMRTVVAQLLLVNRSARLEDVTEETLSRLREDLCVGRRGSSLHAVHRAIAGLGFAKSPVKSSHNQGAHGDKIASQWMTWIERWFATSTLAPSARRVFRHSLERTGRWLLAEHPTIVTPADWSRETCAAWVAQVLRSQIGDYVERRAGLGSRIGRPLAPTTMANHISAVRTLLRDSQEWGWCPRRFDPIKALAIPRSVHAMIGPKPRVIADDIWAKLLWAGLNLETKDLTVVGIRAYPLELLRALALTWLFSGQRSDEIVRLRVGCIRWQPADPATSTGPICLLDIPVNKTGSAFTKPVDPVLGRAVEAWEAARPARPPMIDRKTGEAADLLFACRVIPVAKKYINEGLIPMLCRKAGLAPNDIRGRITSHRARATIASQLYNAKEPMTLFELQAWLGHRSPRTTQYYAQITPNTLTKAYTDAGYFARNVRTIEVLIDREAILTGAAAAGEPWQHYDLGHGYCSYTFFEQCAHRMACARCDFYIPKADSRAQLLEAKTHVDRRLAMIPLTDSERAAIELDSGALERLLEELADKPTPTGQTPRQLSSRTSAAEVGRPVENVRACNTARSARRSLP
jgi:integrase